MLMMAKSLTSESQRSVTESPVLVESSFSGPTKAKRGPSSDDDPPSERDRDCAPSAEDCCVADDKVSESTDADNTVSSPPFARSSEKDDTVDFVVHSSSDEYDEYEDHQFSQTRQCFHQNQVDSYDYVSVYVDCRDLKLESTTEQIFSKDRASVFWACLPLCLHL